MHTLNTRGEKVDYKTISEGEWNKLSVPEGIDKDIDLEDMREKFWSHVYKWGDGCLLWAGSIHAEKKNHHIQTENGRWVVPEHKDRPIKRLHGVFTYKGKKYIAYRASYLLEVGKIPEGYDIHHTCGQPLCVRPNHLKAALYADHLREHNGEGRRRVPTIVRIAMEQLSREEENPNLYTKEQKAYRWSYLRYHIRLRKTALLFDGQYYNWPSATGNITEDRG